MVLAEYLIRERQRQISQELVEATGDVVRFAMERIRREGQQGRLFLENLQARCVYKVVDTMGDCDIMGYQLDIQGNPESRLVPFGVPRDTSDITEDAIAHIRHIHPDGMRQLLTNLTAAVSIPANKFNRIANLGKRLPITWV